MFFQNYLCFLLHNVLKKHRKMLGLRKILRHGQIFALNFQKNIEKVWDIKKILNIAKFRKNQGKND